MDYRKHSNKQEKRIADNLSAAGLKTRRTVNSGAFWSDPGDVRNEMFLIEAKTRVKEGASSFSVKRAVLDKIAREAFPSGRIPIVPFSFDNKTDYVIIEDYYFYNLIQRMLEAEAELDRIKGAT